MSNTVSCEVLLITHNHEKYVRQAIESIAHQDFLGPLKIKVYDDCSTDGTLEALRDFSLEKALNIEFFTTQKNLGIAENYKRAFLNVSSDFVAILEGDDYWLDSQHLSSSIQELNRYPSALASFSSIVVYNEVNHSTQPLRYPDKKFFTARDLAYSNTVGNFSCCVYRPAALLEIVDEFITLDGYDWLSNLLVSHAGLLVHNSSSKTLYRVHTNGLWSSLSEKNKCIKTIAAIERYDRHFQGKYAREFMLHKRRLRNHILVESIKHNLFALQTIQNVSMWLVPSFVWLILGLFLPPKFKHKLNSIVGN